MHTSAIIATAFAAAVAALPKQACYNPDGCGSGYGQGNWQAGAAQYQGAGNNWQAGQYQPAGAYGAAYGQNSNWQQNAQYQQGGQWQQNGQYAPQQQYGAGGNWQQGGNYQSGGVQQQLPLSFGNAGNQQVQIGQLTPCDYETNSISFGNDIHIDIDVNSITCQAFTDADGHDSIGNSFGYDQTCDFDGPTQIRSILCTLS